MAAYVPTSTLANPSVITAAGGILNSNLPREYQFVVGDGPTVVIANPRIQRGARAGQELLLQGTDSGNPVNLPNGNGLALNGACNLGEGSSLYLTWDGENWCEAGRNDNG